MDNSRIALIFDICSFNIHLLNNRDHWRDPDDLPHHSSYYEHQVCRWGLYTGVPRDEKWNDFCGCDEVMVNFIVKLVTPWMKVSERRITTVPLKKRVVICLFHLRNMCTATTTGQIFQISNQLE